MQRIDSQQDSSRGAASGLAGTPPSHGDAAAVNGAPSRHAVFNCFLCKVTGPVRIKLRAVIETYVCAGCWLRRRTLMSEI